jgi:cytochrome c oxidase cbb3-type subunit 2
VNHGPILFLVGLAVMASSWATFVVAPQKQLGNLSPEEIGGSMFPRARAGAASQGREIYRENGCYYCHTHQVRGNQVDIGRWAARRSVAQDYLYDTPVMLGDERLGPDLSNFGARVQDINQVLVRLYKPSLLQPKTTMPGYPFLFEKRKSTGRSVAGEALQLPAGAVEPGYEVVPRPEAYALANYLLSMRIEGSLFEAPLPQQKKAADQPGAAQTNSTNTTNEAKAAPAASGGQP